MLSEGKQSASVVESQVDELENLIFVEIGEIEERRTTDMIAQEVWQEVTASLRLGLKVDRQCPLS